MDGKAVRGQSSSFFITDPGKGVRGSGNNVWSFSAASFCYAYKKRRLSAGAHAKQAHCPQGNACTHGERAAVYNHPCAPCKSPDLCFDLTRGSIPTFSEKLQWRTFVPRFPASDGSLHAQYRSCGFLPRSSKGKYLTERSVVAVNASMARLFSYEKMAMAILCEYHHNHS